VSLPEHRRISTGRTFAQRFDAVRYASPVQGYRAPAPVAAIYKAIAWVVLAVILVPLALHLLLPLVR